MIAGANRQGDDSELRGCSSSRERAESSGLRVTYHFCGCGVRRQKARVATRAAAVSRRTRIGRAQLTHTGASREQVRAVYDGGTGCTRAHSEVGASSARAHTWSGIMNHVRAHALSALPGLRCSMERAQAEASGPGERTGGDKTGTSLSPTGARAKCARGALKPKRAAPEDGPAATRLGRLCR